MVKKQNILQMRGNKVYDKGILIFFCGKMGAGKSTKSKEMSIENSAVLISEDEWLEMLYPQLITSFEDYIKYSALLRTLIKSHVQNILSSQTNVVLDFPANTSKQRTWLKSIAEEINASYRLIYLEVSDAQCLEQIAKRQEEQPQRATFDTEEMFYEVTKFFLRSHDFRNANELRKKE